MRELSTKEIIDIAVKNKLIIIITSLLFFLAGLFYSLTDEKFYTASSSVIQNPDSVLVTDSMSQNQGLEKILNIGGSMSDQSNIYIEIMHSNEFLEYFFNKRDILPLIYAGKTDTNLDKRVINESLYNIENKQWLVNSSFKKPTFNEAKRFWLENIFDFEITKKSIIKIHITFSDRHLAKEWIDQYIYDFNEFIAGNAASNSKLTSNYLERTLDSTSNESTREALNFLLIEQQRKLALANSIPEFALKTINKSVVPDIPSNTSIYLILSLSLIFGLICSFIFVIFRISYMD